jgi:uncharacterized protein with PIN domain
MVVDTSAIVAIALDAPDAPELEERIADDPVRLISAATVLEATIVIESRSGARAVASSTSGWSGSAPRSSLSMPNRRRRRAAPGVATARAVTPPR